MEKIRYIDNDPVKGIKYNYAKISKFYRSLGIPREYDYTEIVPFENDAIKWYNLNSERSVGKTTNLLLYGMCMHEMYGTQIQLVRNHIDKASYYKDLFNTIVNYQSGQYIKKITGDKWNNVKYYQKKFYYIKVDENGKEVDKDSEPFCVSLSCDDCYNLCSTYEAPKGDWIILDECFNDKNTPDEFVRFIHLHKTITRERISDKIFVLGNVLDANNIWYRQLTVQNEIRKLKRGNHKIVYTSEGMPIFISFLENRSPERRKIFNKLHYGFKNPEINAIVGNGEWNMKMYPLTHTFREKGYGIKILIRGIYFCYHDEIFMEGSFIETDCGIYFEIHPANYASAINGDIVFTLTIPMKSNEIFFGTDMLSKKILQYIRAKHVTFNDNETGDLFEKFIVESGVKP